MSTVRQALATPSGIRIGSCDDCQIWFADTLAGPSIEDGFRRHHDEYGCVDFTIQIRMAPNELPRQKGQS